MKSFRALLTIASLLLVSATTLSAQSQVACMDGSRSVGGRGACSGHGGIRTAARKADAKADAKAARGLKAGEKADAKAARAEKRADAADRKIAKADRKSVVNARNDDHDSKGATAECKDHTYSHAKSHQGACSGHGGVAKFLDGR
jgi:CO/xanthine dehydrogenase Mo-binding subunit